MECQYCKKILKTASSLRQHQKTTKYCLALQNRKIIEEFPCAFCGTVFTLKSSLSNHSKICKANNPYIQDKINELEQYKLKIAGLETKLEEALRREQELREDYANLAAISATQSFEEYNTVDIVEEDDSNDNEEEEEYILKDLEVSKGYTISHREEDGYINVTQLCAAGKKKFNDWNRLSKTKSFLQVLSTAVGIPAPALIQVGSGNKFGSTEGQATWVHPQVAINIAQWISPQFDVKVSAWVYEAMMTGKVDISNTKSYRELQKEIKDKDIKINLLTKKYVKKQPRLEIPERNVIYILTTKSMRKERRYILGKATNLTSRLSTYNKTDEHEIVYYQGCEDEDTMGIVETMVLNKLKKYREQANRERFILPSDQDISLFVDTVKSCIEFTK